MIKYENNALQVVFGVLFINLLGIPLFIFGILAMDKSPIVDYVMFIFIFGIAILIVNIVFFLFYNQFYFTYISNNEIYQKLFFLKKKIYINEINQIIFIDNLLILSDKKYNFDSNGSILKKQKIKMNLKQHINIIINLNDKLLPNLLNEKCADIERIIIGKISNKIKERYSIN